MWAVIGGCIRNDFLANQVAEQGNPRHCSYCGERRQAIPLEEMADRIHKVLQGLTKHFNQTRPMHRWSCQIYLRAGTALRQIRV